MSVSGSTKAVSAFTSTKTTGLAGAGASYVATESVNLKYGSGTAANQVDTLFTYVGTLAASTPLVIDLHSFTDAFGVAAQAFARVDHVQVQNLETDDAHVLLLGYATTTSNAWTSFLSNPGQLTVRPGVLQADAPLATGWVVGSSNKLLQLDPGANAVSVKVVVAGRSV